MIVDGFNITTEEGATAYLKSKGVDVEAFIKKSIKELKCFMALNTYHNTKKE